MPPIKGRMMGGRMTGSRVVRAGPQSMVSEYHRVKSLGLARKKSCLHLSNVQPQMSGASKDENLLKLRYPASISQVLPSVKKYRGARGFVDLTDEEVVAREAAAEQNGSHGGSPEESVLSQQVLGVGRPTRGHTKAKYFVRCVADEKFSGMIWDVAFSPSGDVVVACASGVFICDRALKVQRKLDNIILAGGVAFLSDDSIVAICRNSDTVNIFDKHGKWLRAFAVGKSPMAVAINNQDQLIVCDPGAKCVHVYTADGTSLMSVGPHGADFNLRWPLYVTCLHKDNSFLITDCHSQSVLKFDAKARYMHSLKMHTFAGSQVLRPHGVCAHASGDFLVIDHATNTVEVFDSDERFVQTLIPAEEGQVLRPKVLSVQKEFMVLGGLGCTVRLYEFVDEQKINIKPIIKNEVHRTPTKKQNSQRQQVKQVIVVVKEEVKEEVFEMTKREFENNENNPVVLDDSDNEMDEVEKGKEMKQECATSKQDKEEEELKEEEEEKADNSFVMEHVSDNHMVLHGDGDGDDDDEEDSEEEHKDDDSDKPETINDVIILDDD